MLATPEIDAASTSHQRAQGLGKLRVKSQAGSSTIENLYQQGCAKIRIPKSYDDSIQAITINSSGGLTGGDEVRWDFALGAHSKSTITTQACERVYKSSGGNARVHVNLTIENSAQLAWLPQETIVFNGGNLTRLIEADLATNAEILIVEPLIMGRRAMGETVNSGIFRDRWRIRRNGSLIHAEDFRLNGDIAAQLCQEFVTAGHEAFATIILISPRAEGSLCSVRELIGGNGSASFWNGKLLARITAQDGYSLRNRLIPIINLLNFNATVPKVWSL